MVGWHPRLNGHEFEEALGDGEGQGSLVCCSPWGGKESGTTDRRQQIPGEDWGRDGTYNTNLGHGG